MAASRMPQVIAGQEFCACGTASDHSPASHQGASMAVSARCGQSPSSSDPAIAPTAHNGTAEGQCSCILKICPAMAMAPPSATVPTACSVTPRARNRSNENAPARWNPPTANTSSAMRWKGESSSQCALTNRRTPAASIRPPNATAIITGHRARRRGTCSDSNCRMRSACWRSRIFASTQRSSDGSSSILMCLRTVQRSRQMRSGAESVTYKNKRSDTKLGLYILCLKAYNKCTCFANTNGPSCARMHKAEPYAPLLGQGAFPGAEDGERFGERQRIEPGGGGGDHRSGCSLIDGRWRVSVPLAGRLQRVRPLLEAGYSRGFLRAAGLRLFDARDQLAGGFERDTAAIEELRDLFGDAGRGPAGIERGLHLHIVRHRAHGHVGHLDALFSLGRNGFGDGLILPEGIRTPGVIDQFDEIGVERLRRVVLDITAVQDRQKSNDPCCKRGLWVPGTGNLRSGSTVSS